MKLFSRPTYKDRLAEFSGNAAERISESLPDVTDTEFARGLGWASIGIGLTELLAPRQVNDLLGLDDTPDRRGTVRVLGVRELCHGVNILTENTANEKLASGVFARVAGDALDSVALGIAATKTKHPFRFAVVTAMVMGIGLADVLCAKRLASRVH
jgi:hypothetical protein